MGGGSAAGRGAAAEEGFDGGRDFAAADGSDGRDGSVVGGGSAEGWESSGRGGRRASDRGGRGRRRGGDRGPEGPVPGSVASQGPDADPEAVARAICLRLLTLAPRTRAQLAEALRKREVPEAVAERVLARFTDVGLIDDEAFAAAWVSSRHAGRGLARRALAAELRRRGVDDDTVRDAVDQLDPEQELETARGLVARKLRSTRGLDPAVRTRRLAGMLARKGYSGSLAYRVIREALEAEGESVDGLPDDSFG
ncbi:recombination regulator RecX [Thermocatellispora tengchongensis]|uniref:recombination regulator RecX n=1 Tax=Thermocatellispora tengchongensis TaxID=1073253 RepID=UPI0036373924